MATRTISAAGGNWNQTATWDEGVSPVDGDAVVARGDGTSGNLTVTASAQATSINFTNYSGTFTINSGQTCVLKGDYYQSATMTVAGTGILNFSTASAASNFTFNGITFTGAVTTGNTGVALNFVDNGTINGVFTNTSSGTLTALVLNVGGLLMSGTMGASSTATKIVVNGTWSGNGIVRTNLELNSSTVISGTVRTATNTISDTAAATTTGSTIGVAVSGTTIFNCTYTTFSIINLTASGIILQCDGAALAALTITSTVATLTFSGAYGFNISTLSLVPTASGSVTFKSGNTYNVSTLLRARNLFTSYTFLSSVSTNAAYLILATAGTQEVLRVKATDIDSSGGEPIRSVGIRPQDLLRTSNWTNNSGQFYNFF